MSEFTEISPQQAWQMVQNENGILLDVRDQLRFSQSHPQRAFHLTNQTFLAFERLYQDGQPIIVICYHGVSSRSVAHYLSEQGYENIYSVKGGFAAWQLAELPIDVA